MNIQSLHILGQQAGHATAALDTSDRAQALKLLDPESII